MLSLNHTQAVTTALVRCGRYCALRIVSNKKLDIGDRLFACLVGCNSFPISDRDYNMKRGSGTSPEKIVSTATLSPKSTNQENSNDAILQFVAFKILLPIVLVLIAVCFVLGVVLIVKSYMMMPLKQNLATAIRRRRKVGHAPSNNYIPADEMRASQRWSSSSDRKSLPPPEVLAAARERASQLYGGANFV